MIPSKEDNKFLVIDPKEMGIYKLPDKRFKIICLKKLDVQQENTIRQLNEISKTIHKQNEFNNEIEITMKNETEILECFPVLFYVRIPSCCAPWVTVAFKCTLKLS